MSHGYRNLGEFIKRLEKEGELIRIRERVSPVLEITEFADRFSKSPDGGKALLFEDVEGSAFPVLINAFGSMKRISLALGSSPDALASRLEDILEQGPPGTIREKLRLIPRAYSWSRFFPRSSRMKNPPCQEVVLTGSDINLFSLPVLHCWPKDGGRFVTLPVVISKGLFDSKRNVGMYRMQVYDRNTTGMHWHIHKDGSHHFHEYRKAGRRMQLAVAIGTDPALTYAATAPMPRGVDEMILAGFIRQEPVTMVKGITVDIEVPAEAEFILEGYVDPEETRTEGPFGDHTGYYSLEDEYPVFHVTAVTHKKNPVYSATVVGRPPMEDCYMALATERLFLPLIRKVMPEIKDYHLPWEGVFHNIVFVAIDKLYPAQAFKLMSGLWGSGQMSFAKAIVVADDESLLKRPEQLLRHILESIDPESDIMLTEGILDVLDHSAPQGLYGSKIGIDATSRIKGEKPRATHGSLDQEIHDGDLVEQLKKTDRDFLAVRTVIRKGPRPLVLLNVAKHGDRNSKHFIEAMSVIREIASQAVWVLYDKGIDLDDNSLVLWKVFNNVDPVRDITFEENHVIIDATKKTASDGHERPWPDDIEMDPDVQGRVSAMIERLGLL